MSSPGRPRGPSLHLGLAGRGLLSEFTPSLPLPAATWQMCRLGTERVSFGLGATPLRGLGCVAWDR